MKIRLTKKCQRGIGLRSITTKKLERYVDGDELEVSDNVAAGLINSGMAEKVEESDEEKGEEADYEQMTTKELAAVLKEQGKSTSGKKEELIARLTEE